jgi:Tfp pilus assembly protein PilF
MYKKIGKETIKLAKILNNIGYVHDTQGRVKQARGYYERAINIRMGNE